MPLESNREPMQLRTLARVLFESSRPAQILLVLAVYGFGATVALAESAHFSAAALAAGGVVLLPIAASIHYANEYADYETDAVTRRTPFSGGSGVLHRTGYSRRVVLLAALGSLAVGAVLTAGFALVGLFSPLTVAILAVSTLFGWQYSVGPLKLAWRGWGELDNAALGGLALPVYGAAVLDGPLRFVALVSVPFFLLVLLNLFATQWPDRAADAQAGKRTLAVRWPRRRLRWSYVAIAVVAGGALLALAGTLLPLPVAAASLLAAPLVAYGAYGYTRRHVPWPTVGAMMVLLAAQALAWCWVEFA